jgi:glycerol-3-phosphate acyltransferase PlsX
MRIALDAMGSDGAPGPEVDGAVHACAAGDLELVLVGDEEKLNATLAHHGNPANVSVVHASEVITMHDSPVLAVRGTKDASLLVAIRLIKQGEADGVVSAGNTGAVMVAARTILGPIKGVARSAICQLLPTTRKPVLLMDLGANVDCTARHLCDFAEMGSVYMTRVLGIQNPRVGLLNIGEEQLKGNELAKTVHRNLSAANHINFIGNVEPRMFYEGAADVIVCDGFVGNVVLKTSEAVGGLMANLLARELSATWIAKLGAFLCRGAFSRLRCTVDANEYAGAPLLGVNGVVIILHGACSGKGVANAIQGAIRAARAGVNDFIREGIHDLRDSEAHLVEQERER